MHMLPQPKAALTVAEFCATLSIGRTLFYERVRLGQIQILKVGTKTLVPTHQVEAFLEQASAHRP